MAQALFDFIQKYITPTEQEKQAILDLDVFRIVKKGSLLLKEGDYSKESYFIINGGIRCFFMHDGVEKTTAFFTEAETYAPLCSINNSASDHFIEAFEDSLISISNPDLEQTIFEKFPRFETLCRLLSEELLAKSQTSFNQFKHSSPEDRYKQILATRPDLLQRVPLHQLASYLGITPESLSRIRKRIQH